MQKAREALVSIVYVYFFLCIVLIPFQYFILPWQRHVSDVLFGQLIRSLALFIPINIRYNEISSDSASMYLLLLVLLMLTTGIGLLFYFFIKSRDKLYLFLRSFFTYFLALQLLKYGFDKIFKAQFYLPEPNTLYTPLGQLSKDLLFWSTIGVSHSYNVFTGLAEVIPAILLLFKRTRILGLLWSAVVLINIVAINFSFDISVKLYSIFLLLITVVLLFPQLQYLFEFLVIQKNASLKAESETVALPIWFKVSLKIFIIGLIFLEALYPYLRSGDFNDDNAKRPYLHGAYEVRSYCVNVDTMNISRSPMKRFFIHRMGYFIVQDQSDKMQDYKLQIDSVTHIILLTDGELNRRYFQYEYHLKDSTLILKDEKEIIKAKILDWQKLPALQNDFHWTIDQVK